MSTTDDGANDVQERPCSIDLTLELERQLDNESLPPPTPADAQRPQSVDTQVLAHIVTNLQSSLAEVTRHRDELANSLSQVQAREKDFTDTLTHMTAKCSRLQEELNTANDKAKDDENTISVLRTKVEESRRGLMRLQSESRRQSQVASGLDFSRANLASLAGPQTSKRASFAPLTGSNTVRINAHRRISSVSDSGFAKLDSGSPLSSPAPTNFTFPDNAMLPSKLAPLPRSSGMYGRASPPLTVFHSEESAEVEMLRKELISMRGELEEARHEINEANEAREASELCVKALRVFIEENDVGAMPNAGGSAVTTPTFQAEPKKSTQVGGSWGFKLWRTEALAKSASGAIPIPFIPPTPNNVSSPPPQPLSRKLGEFFGARSASISSTTPVKSPRAEPEAMYNGLSDTSSIEESLAEPVSPASELARTRVLVRDTTSVISGCSARDLGASPERKTGGLASEGVFTPVAI
ncbi:hypothetical protein J3R82DRAFT_2356 [Butyriboletus roseoflavus]|nr:hypothetical protein J3R82DRAFT_2356 [Butyriboletus roseoflavus]